MSDFYDHLFTKWIKLLFAYDITKINETSENILYVKSFGFLKTLNRYQ